MAVDAERRAVGRCLRTHGLNVGTEGVAYVLGPCRVFSRPRHVCNPPAARTGDHRASRSGFVSGREGILENDRGEAYAPTVARRSISKRRSPWNAELGNAWWLLCQDSPKESQDNHQTFLDSSRDSKRRLPQK